MSPYEIVYPGGSVEHWNEETGTVWLERILRVYPHTVWLNPIKEGLWGNTQSIGMVKQIMGERMYPLTLEGLERATKELSR